MPSSECERVTLDVEVEAAITSKHVTRGLTNLFGYYLPALPRHYSTVQGTCEVCPAGPCRHASGAILAYEIIPTGFRFVVGAVWSLHRSFFCRCRVQKIFGAAEPHPPLAHHTRLSFPPLDGHSPSLQPNMTASSLQPETVLSPLPKADGSATYSYAGYTITASANGPIEAQRKDEDPYEAVADVLVRPASGVGG